MLHDDVDVSYLQSQDNAQQQKEQIQQLIDNGTDLLIISPIDEHSLKSVIIEAKEKSIPIVLVDRKVDSNDFETYIHGDNIEVGKLAANYIASNIYKGERIIELEGDTASTPVKDRHKGFKQITDSLGLHSESYICNWKRDKSQAVIDSLLRNTTDNYIVFCHNDGMAFDVFNKAKELGLRQRVKLVGVDGLCGEGIDMIDRGELVASVRYPTGGREAMIAAISILKGEKVQKDILIKPFIADISNTSILRTQDSKILELANDNTQLGSELTNTRHYLWGYSIPTIIFFAIITVLLAWLLIHIYKENKKNQKLRKEAEEKLQLYLNSKFNRNTTKIVSDIEIPVEDEFMKRLTDSLQKNISNADATADDLAACMNMGRQQFFNKVKSHTGYTPKEMLRIARLKQAAALLESGNHNVQEVCYKVGFSTPSYFAKCFKEYYGVLPSDYTTKQ